MSEEDRLTRLYRRFMDPLLRDPRRALGFWGCRVLLLAAIALVPSSLVR